MSPFIERAFQWATIYLDPQKKEGEAKPDGDETLSGEACSRFHFTNQNNGDAYEAWVAKKDGRIVQLRVTPSAANPLVLILTTHGMGKPATIEEPK